MIPEREEALRLARATLAELDDPHWTDEEGRPLPSAGAILSAPLARALLALAADLEAAELQRDQERKVVQKRGEEIDRQMRRAEAAERKHAEQVERNRELHKLGAQQRAAMEARAEAAERERDDAKDAVQKWYDEAHEKRRDLAAAEQKNEKLSALIVEQEKLYREERKAAERELKRIRSVPSHQRTLQVLAERERADAAERQLQAYQDEGYVHATEYLAEKRRAEAAERERDELRGDMAMTWEQTWKRLRKAERDLATAREALERIEVKAAVHDGNGKLVDIARTAHAALRSLGQKA